MKTKNVLIGLIALFALSGCTFLDRFFPHKKETPTDQKDDSSGDGGQSPTEEKKKIGEFYGGVVNNGSYVGYEFSKSNEDIVKPSSGTGEVNIYAFNDFHGAVLETNDEVGLKRLGTFYKEKSQERNTLILDQGDTWQGSFESNYKHGAIVQDVFNYAGVTLRTVGNHDFDWGLKQLEDTNNRKLGDDYIPCLASNVFDYKDGQNGTIQQSKYGKDYATFIIDNGIKVGVVGVIGYKQITSISSQLVNTICFTNHIQRIKRVSDYLRSEKKCDIIIASTHESSGDIYGLGLDEVSANTNKRYADLVLSGHAHYRQEYTSNGVKYVQWDSNGQSTGSIKLKYDFATSSLLDNQTEVNSYYPNYYKAYYSTIEPTIEKMVDDYLIVTQPVSELVLSSNFSGNWSTTNLAYLMAESMYFSVKSSGKPIDFAVCNSARDSFNGSEFTFGNLYKCFPFDNQIILMDVSSSTSCSTISYSQSYKEDTSIILSPGNTYHVAVIDYVGLHQNDDREYDRFPDASNQEIYKDDDGNALYYRDILMNYLLDNPTKQFNASDYTSNNPHFSF